MGVTASTLRGCVLGTFAALALVACGGYVAPVLTPTQRPPTEVSAPVARTWDALVDHFAAQNIQIRTMDRTSGFLEAVPSGIPRGGESLADCGTLDRTKISPSIATYNVTVRGDSTHATVLASVRYLWNYASLSQHECRSLGVLEKYLEDAVKARAEAPR